ncbi:MAG: hypothetical protein ACLVFN_13255 [Enterocloster sp.]
MNRNELVVQISDMAALMNTIALAIHGVQGEPKPKTMLEYIAKTAKNVAEQCDRLRESLEAI